VTTRQQIAVMGAVIVGALAATDLYVYRTPNSTAQSTTADNPCYINNGLGSTAALQTGNCRNRSGRFLGLRMVNTSVTKAYLKMYNLSVAPICNSANGLQEIIPIPANENGGGIVDTNSNYFYNAGVGYCLVGQPTATDASAPPAGVFGSIRTGN
jgi:hypothetical protein